MVDEDLEPLITRCPNCSTQFRVTENQLAAAGGRVRCGACLTVFEGTEHLILDEDATFTDGSEADAALDALLDELGNTEARASMDTGPTAQEEDLPSDSHLAPDSDVVDDVQVYGGYEDESAPEVEVVSDAEAAASNHPETGAEESPTASGIENPEPDTVEQDTALDGESAAELEDLESGTPVLHEQPEAPDSRGHDPAYEAWIQPGTRNIDQLVDEVMASGSQQPDVATELENDPEPSSPAEEEKAAVGGFHLSAVESALAEEGVATGPIHFGPEPRRWWVLGAGAVLVLTLLGQIFYLQLPQWSRDPGTRGFYESVCGLFGCELPEIRDLDALRTRNLMVRSHPDLRNALIIDAVIVNLADFPQRFPDLVLRFTSVGGLLVAGRSFTPEEYLAGEAGPERLMPVNTPVQVSVEIADPGDEAVNYTLSFR